MALRLYNKILIANRGEIACRVIKTAKRLGIRTVAVYSDADSNALHTKLADESFNIGPAQATLSYLNKDKLLQVATETGSQALHPGYGFLSENADFAKRCQQSGIEFIGPPASAILSMGSKSDSKRIMEAAQVPVVPGYHQDDQSYETLKQQADKIGYPVLIKAVMGGGGKGMKLAFTPKDFEASLESAIRESQQAFADDRVILEKYIINPRHIEFQVFCDKHGNGVHLYERDCSIQRRHQKVIEEAPSLLNFDQRMQMGQSAVQAAKAVGYVGAGTVEFIFDEDTQQYYFMEMNTRLQVEHPVTEMITGQDLVEWQIRVAAGEQLPLKQEEIQINGHAVEARVYAEDPQDNFMPSIGKIVYFRKPQEQEYVRVDTGVHQGDSISMFYDPMIAKVICWGSDRYQGIARLNRALQEFKIAGVSTNIALLSRILENDQFQEQQFNTNFLSKNKEVLEEKELSAEQLAISAVCKVILESRQYEQTASPWKSLLGFRLNDKLRKTVRLNNTDIQITLCDNVYEVLIGEQLFKWSVQGFNPIKLQNKDKILEYHTTETDEFLYIMPDIGQDFKVELPEKVKDYAKEGSSDLGDTQANIPGRVTKVYVKEGDKIEQGDNLVVLESMKMEHIIKANRPGTVKQVTILAGEFVEAGQILVVME